MDERERGTGRTTRLLSMTPQGGMFITHSPNMVSYIHKWAKANGQSINITSMGSVRAIGDAIRGKRHPVIVMDHTVAEFASNEQWEAMWETIRETSLSCVSCVVVYMDPDGAIKTWNKP